MSHDSFGSFVAPLTASGSPIMLPLNDIGSEGIPNSSPAEATPSAPAFPVATPQGNAPPATPASSAASPISGPAGTPPQEGWVPSYRIREAREAAVRTANAEFAQREASIRAEANRYRDQLHSLVGATPPANPEIAAVRSQFEQLYPGLGKIEARAQDLLGILDKAGDFDSQNTHYWQSYGRQTMDRLFTHAAETLGSPLNDEGKRALHSSFTGWVQSSPELSERYANDPTLVTEFWKAFSSTFIDPARRTAAATVQGRAAFGANLPQDTPGGAPRSTPAPTPANLDERASAGWAQYNLINNRG